METSGTGGVAPGSLELGITLGTMGSEAMAKCWISGPLPFRT